MIPSLLYIAEQYGPPVFSGIVAAFLSRAYFDAKKQNKLKDCQNDLTETQQKIAELEAFNEHLQKRLKEMESYFSKDRIIMN